MAEKTEKATPKKLRDARKKGQVAKAQDLPSAFTFIASIGVLLALSGFLYTQLTDFIKTTFNMIATGGLDGTIPNLFMQAFVLIFLCSIPILILVSFVGVIVTFCAIGPVFSLEVFKPDIKKFNPIENLKQKFKFKTLFELLKSVVKIALAAYLIYGVVYKSLPILIQTSTMPVWSSLIVFNVFLTEVLWKVGILFVVIAVADFVFQKRTFAKEMKMEKFEVKQEYKNTEGDPQIKSKRRQNAQEIAYQDGPGNSLRRAQAIVTNPTHLAIAVGYIRGVDVAPYILAMGSGELATRIIKQAGSYGIPVVRNIRVARKLWDEGEVYEYVPEDTYEALAEILRWIASLEENPELGHMPPEEET